MNDQSINNQLKKLDSYLKSISLPLGWKLHGVGFNPGGEIRIVLDDDDGLEQLTLGLSALNRNMRCYAETRSFNVGVIKETGADLSPEEQCVVNFLVVGLRKFDDGTFNITPDVRKSKIRVVDISDADGIHKAVTIVLGSKCDWKCSFCPSSERILQENDEVEDDDILNQVKSEFMEWEKCKYSNMVVTGNEATVHKSFLDILDILTPRFPHVMVQTNGLRLHDVNFIGRIKYLEKVLFDIPLYGPSPDIHSSITGEENSYSRIISLIENSPLNIRVHTVIVNNNMGRLVEIKRICDANQREHQFNLLHEYSRSDLYRENAPRLTDVTNELNNVFMNKNDCLNFIQRNRQMLPPCIVLWGFHESKYDPVQYDSLDARCTVSYHYDKGSNMMPCRYRKKCSVSQYCPGVIRSYIELYGWNEFKPI